MPRPVDLPDFKKPPLHEVVIGIQFQPPIGYTQILAGKVRALFEDRFPDVQELPNLPPQFETFGTAAIQQSGLMFVSSSQHNRYWFCSNKDPTQLIQFQQDRLLHNWRKVEGYPSEYPRFEKMYENFEFETKKLELFFRTLSPQSLICNQVEISYVNHIMLDRDNFGTAASDYLKMCNFQDICADDCTASYRRALTEADGNARRRLIFDLQTGVAAEGRKILVITLTVRGAPVWPTLESSLDFLRQGRETIVREFASITTHSAHRLWERSS